jgi:hypothetical protein
MQKLLFFSRVSFICNVCFVVTFIMQYVSWLPEMIFSSTIIILGNVFALFVNLVVNLAYGFLLITGSKKLLLIPRWLIIANFLFFVVQLTLILK